MKQKNSAATKNYRKSFFLLCLAILFLSQSNSNVLAQGFFECGYVDAANPCVNTSSRCDPSYAPTKENKTCDQFDDFTCPYGSNLCEKTTAPRLCTPNKQYCEGSVLKLCNSAGTGSTGPSIDCQTQGKECLENADGASCVDKIPIPTCYEECMSTYNDKDTCKGFPPCSGGGGGGGGTKPPCNTPNSCQDTSCQVGFTPTSGTCTAAGFVCCAAYNQPNPQGVVIDLKSLIDNTLGGLGFKFNSSSTFGTIISGIIPILFGVAGTALLLYLIAAGFQYLASAGDPKKMEAAKNMITMAVVGFTIIISAYWITQVVQFVFGLASDGQNIF